MNYVEDHLLKKFPEAGSIRSDTEKRELLERFSWLAFANAELSEHFEIELTPEVLISEIKDFYLMEGYMQNTTNPNEIKFEKDGVILTIHITELFPSTTVSVVAIDK